jgi:hypothetical protein
MNINGTRNIHYFPGCHYAEEHTQVYTHFGETPTVASTFKVEKQAAAVGSSQTSVNYYHTNLNCSMKTV